MHFNQLIHFHAVLFLEVCDIYMWYGLSSAIHAKASSVPFMMGIPEWHNSIEIISTRHHTTLLRYSSAKCISTSYVTSAWFCSSRSVTFMYDMTVLRLCKKVHVLRYWWIYQSHMKPYQIQSTTLKFHRVELGVFSFIVTLWIRSRPMIFYLTWRITILTVIAS